MFDYAPLQSYLELLSPKLTRLLAVQETLPGPKQTPVSSKAALRTVRLRADRHLIRRSLCSDALGPNRSDKNCGNGETLCCLDSPNPFPQCQTHMNLGWCIVDNNATARAYTDQASYCGQDGAVQCTNLAKGTTQACCPKNTVCAPEFSASTGIVRCQVQYGDLLKAEGLQLVGSSTSALVSSTSTQTSSQVTTGASTTTASTMTAPSTSNSPSPSRDLANLNSSGVSSSASSSSSTPSLAGGAIAGIVIGIVAVLVLGLLASWTILRRRKRVHPSVVTVMGAHHAGQGSYAGKQTSMASAPQGAYDPKAHPRVTAVAPSEMYQAHPPVSELDNRTATPPTSYELPAQH